MQLRVPVVSLVALMAVAPGVAAAAAPVVEPGAAVEISTDGATLTGTVIPGTDDTRYSFQYGTTEGYGIGTPIQVAQAGAGSTAAQAAITGLGAGRTWHYRLVATNADGVTYGPDQTLTTALPAAPPLVVPQLPTAVESGGATLQAFVDPAGQPTSVVFEYGATPALGSASAPVAVGEDRIFAGVDAAIAGLQPNTTYFFRAVASNAAGSSVSPTLAFTTSAAVSKLTVAASSRTLVWGQPAELTGVAEGTGVEGSTVVLLRQDFPFTSARTQVATATVGAGGAYAFAVGPLPATTRFWVQSRTVPALTSAPVDSYAKLAVTLRSSKPTRTSVTLSGSVSPYVASARATLQRRAGSGRWITVSRPALKRVGATDRATFTATGRRYEATMKYRVLVDPRNAGAHYSTASSVLGVARQR